MSQILDARGNEWQGSLDQLGGIPIVDARVASFVIGVLNAEVVVDLNGKATCSFDVRTVAGNLTFLCEGTVDGVNYFLLPMFINQQLLAGVLLTEQYVSSVVVATTQSGFYVAGVTGLKKVRIRISAYTSGNITVTPRASVSDLVIYGRPVPATLHVTAVSAANTLLTLTIPGVLGLFHYITYLNCRRNATAALAGTGTLTITTTNLPGNPAWSSGNAMIAGGTEEDIDMQPSSPLRAAASNANTTITMPAAGAAVLNRINVSYFLGA